MSFAEEDSVTVYLSRRLRSGFETAVIEISKLSPNLPAFTVYFEGDIALHGVLHPVATE